MLSGRGGFLPITGSFFNFSFGALDFGVDVRGSSALEEVGTSVGVLGTSAIFAFEYFAAEFFSAPLLATSR